MVHGDNAEVGLGVGPPDPALGEALGSAVVPGKRVGAGLGTPVGLLVLSPLLGAPLLAVGEGVGPPKLGVGNADGAGLKLGPEPEGRGVGPSPPAVGLGTADVEAVGAGVGTPDVGGVGVGDPPEAGVLGLAVGAPSGEALVGAALGVRVSPPPVACKREAETHVTSSAVPP